MIAVILEKTRKRQEQTSERESVCDFRKNGVQKRLLDAPGQERRAYASTVPFFLS